MNKTSQWLVLAASATLLSPSVSAKEGPDQYPNGSESFMAGALPPPGHYFINYLGNYRGDYRDEHGRKVPGVRVDATFDALRYVFVSEHKILGGDWGMHAIVPLVYQRLHLGSTGSTFGIGDITVDPLIIGWHFPPDWHVTFGLDINLPTGKYDRRDPTESIGANYTSIEPALAFTYLNRDGLELSAKLMYNFKSRNRDTDYQSGDEFHMDYLVGKHFGPWALGLGGYYLQQTTNDKLNGRKVGTDGNRGEVFAVGPAVKYSVKGMTFIGSWYHESHVENRFQGDKVLFKAIIAF